MVETLKSRPWDIRQEDGLPALAKANLLAAASEAVDAEFSTDEVADFIHDFALLVEDIDPEEVRVDESKALTSYIKLALRAQYEQMRALAEGGNQPNLNLSKVKGIELRLPPKTEQVEIVRRVESLFALADAIEAKWQAAHAQVERLTPALLAKAYRGELVPQDPSDEPASALLARLRGGPGAAAAPPRKRGHRRVTPESAEAIEEEERLATIAAMQRRRK